LHSGKKVKENNMNQISITRSNQRNLKDLGKEEQEKVIEFAKALSSHKNDALRSLIDIARHAGRTRNSTRSAKTINK